MRLPFRALRDPLSQQTNLRLGQSLAGFWRRHPVVSIFGSHQLEQFAFRWIASDDGEVARLEFGEGALFLVVAETGFAFVFIRPMAGVTILGKNRANVAIEGDESAERWS